MSLSAKKTSSLKNLRDSGCFEEDLQGKRRVKASANCKTLNPSNNLDRSNKNALFTVDGRKPLKNLAILKQFQNYSGANDVENVEMDVLSSHVKINYHPNIPVSDQQQRKNAAKDFLEQTREVLDRAREIANNSREILERSSALDAAESSKGRATVGGGGGGGVGEESCETNAKMSIVKYVVGGYNDLGVNCESGNAGFSEKSSDSGVSSSSLSSSNFKERKIGQTGESPKNQRLDSPKGSDKTRLFGPICDMKESPNPFVCGTKGRSAENGKDGLRKGSPTRAFPAHFQNRSLIVQKKS